MNKLVLIVLIILLQSCSGSDDLDGRHSRDYVQLKEMKAKWYSMKPSNYQYIIQHSCYCVPIYLGPFQVVIKNNQLDTVYFTNPELIEAYFAEEYPDDPLLEIMKVVNEELITGLLIDSIFSRLEEDLLGDPYSFSVDYDETYGFPSDFYFDYDKNIADEEFGSTISDFEELE